MNESQEFTHIEQNKKSKKIKKTFNILDFVVVKRKKLKNVTKKVKVAKSILRRGKVRKKKLSTVKKKIIRERKAKLERLIEKAQNRIKALENIPEETEEAVIEERGETILNSGSIEAAEDFSGVTKDADDKESSICKDFKNLEITEEEKVQRTPVTTQHSRNFREYCNHFITPEIKKYTEQILKDLFRFQENKFEQNPVKAKANKRYVVGFKEVRKFLVVKRLKLIIIAPDLERNSEIDQLITEIKLLAEQNKTPYVFSIKRRHIGYLLLKKVPVSLVGIFDYQGTNENVTELLQLAQAEKTNYKNKNAKFS